MDTLQATSRDLERQDKVVMFDKESAVWTVVQDYNADDTQSNFRPMTDQVLTHLASLGGKPRTPKAAAAEMGADYQNVKKAMLRLAKSGQILRNSIILTLSFGLSDLTPSS